MELSGAQASRGTAGASGLRLARHVPGDGRQPEGGGAPAAGRGGAAAAEAAAGRGGEGQRRQREQRRDDAEDERRRAPVHAALPVEAHERLRIRRIDRSITIGPGTNEQLVQTPSRAEMVRRDWSVKLSLALDLVPSATNPKTAAATPSTATAALTNTTRFSILRCHSGRCAYPRNCF
jgi:hypothetical protein